MKKMKKNNKGFTLVELIVVIAILGVLAAVLVPQYIQYVEKSKEGTDVATLGEILHAAEVTAAEGTTTTFTIGFSGGAVTIPTELAKIVPSAALKSTDGKGLDGNATISVSSTGKVGWGSTQASTETAFPGLVDGTKGTGTVATAGIVTKPVQNP